MKLQRLSIFSDATESGSASESTADSQTGFSNYRARYQKFLNQQTAVSTPKIYGASSPIRFLQGVFSFALFVAMFLMILTLVGFGLSGLGVIAQVSPSSASSKNSEVKKDTAQPPASRKASPR